MTTPSICAFCERPIAADPQVFGDAYIFDCVRCGQYILSGTLRAMLARLDSRSKSILSIVVRRRPKDSKGFPPTITTDNVGRLVESYRQPTPAERRRRVLLHVAEESSDVGAQVSLPAQDWYPFFECHTEGALQRIYRSLAETGELEDDGLSGQLVLSMKGWEAVSPAGRYVPRTCFVAMSFEPALTRTYDNAIAPAVSACQLDLVRLDRVHHNENINDRILADIRKCEVLIADFTDHRGGVYFEAGFALGLDRTVVFTCRESDFERGTGVHFDTRPYNHILWSDDTLSKFRDDLTARLQNTVPSLKRGNQ